MSFDTLFVMKIPNDDFYPESTKRIWNNRALLVDTSPLLRVNSGCPTSGGPLLSRRTIVELCTKLEVYNEDKITTAFS